MLKRIWPGLLFIFKNKPALSGQAQTAIENYLLDVGHLTGSRLGSAYAPVSKHWIRIYSGLHASLSKSFYMEVLKQMMEQDAVKQRDEI